jgi:hypothetical protein
MYQSYVTETVADEVCCGVLAVLHTQRNVMVNHC